MINNLKFTLLGDPALTIAFPRYRVQTNQINNHAVSATPDTLKALKQYTIAGSIVDNNGNPMSNFTGKVYTSVYDKPQTATTLANDAESLKANFETQENIVFKGMTDVKNGTFTFSFVIPKDIDYKFGNGKISYYADNGTIDANGSFTDFIIGGSQGTSPDLQGPVISAFINDETFNNGGSTGPNPVLLLKLNDTSGINILGTGIGHDITVMIDNDPKRLFKLNDFFEPVLNTYQSGVVNFTLPTLAQGQHTLTIKAWDAANNSSEVFITFNVVKNKSFTISKVINFPNPFTTRTTFRFQHDLDAQDIDVQVDVFTRAGQLLKSLKRTINTGGNRSSDIDWDTRSDSGSPVMPGIYFYRLRVTTRFGAMAQKAGKLVVQ